MEFDHRRFTEPFSIGEIVMTPDVLSRVSGEEIETALRRHCSGDWGNLSVEDWEANNRALHMGARILSSYLAVDDTTFWIVTEASRTSTTVLLPEEY